MLGAPRRGFDRDHYDIPSDRFAPALWLGARLVTTKEIAIGLQRSGLRRPKHMG
jgi:hypothetical protein